MKMPIERHWREMKAAMRYVAQTVHTGGTYQTNSGTPPTMALLQGFEDERFGSDEHNRKSTNGTVCNTNGSPVGWMTKQKTVLELSNYEAE